jgi:hypothetical protein
MVNPGHDAISAFGMFFAFLASSTFDMLIEFLSIFYVWSFGMYRDYLPQCAANSLTEMIDMKRGNRCLSPDMTTIAESGSKS